MEIKKKILLFLNFTVMLILFTGCGAKEKTITEDDMTITLTEDFKKSSLANATWYYESTNALVMGIRETKDELEHTGLEVNSLNDYASAVIETNGLSSVTAKERGDYLYFEYDKTIGGTKYSYMTCLYDHNEEYWMINFACYEQRYDKLKDDFLEWADSVSFN